MKKLILIASVLTLASCTKEKENEDCRCGTVISNDRRDYSIMLRSHCDGKVDKYILSEKEFDLTYLYHDKCF